MRNDFVWHEIIKDLNFPKCSECGKPMNGKQALLELWEDGVIWCSQACFDRTSERETAFREYQADPEMFKIKH